MGEQEAQNENGVTVSLSRLWQWIFGSLEVAVGAGCSDRVPVLWFYARTKERGIAALVMVHQILLEYNQVQIILSLEDGVMVQQMQSKGGLPKRVSIVHAPNDAPHSILGFVQQWKPVVAVFMDLPYLPLSFAVLHLAKIRLVLLDASMSEESFYRVHKGLNRIMYGKLLQCFDLIIPQSGADIARFRMLGAQQRALPGWCNDLTQAAKILAPIWSTQKPPRQLLYGLKKCLQQVPSWLAVQIGQQEYEIICWVQKMLLKDWKGLTMFVVLEDPNDSNFANTVQKMGLSPPTIWDGSLPHFQQIISNTNPIILCPKQHVSILYAVINIVFIGTNSEGDEWEGVIGEAALYGCAILQRSLSQQQLTQQQLQQQSSQQQQKGNMVIDLLNQMAVTAANEIVYAMYTCGTHVELFQEEMMEQDIEQSEAAGEVGNPPVSVNNETDCFTTGSSFQWETSPDMEYDGSQLCSLRAMTAAQYGRTGGSAQQGGVEEEEEGEEGVGRLRENHHTEQEERPQTAPASLTDTLISPQARVGRLERVISGELCRADSRMSGYSTDGIFLARAGSNAMELRPSPDVLYGDINNNIGDIDTNNNNNTHNLGYYFVSEENRENRFMSPVIKEEEEGGEAESSQFFQYSMFCTTPTPTPTQQQLQYHHQQQQQSNRPSGNHFNQHANSKRQYKRSFTPRDSRLGRMTGVYEDVPAEDEGGGYAKYLPRKSDEGFQMNGGAGWCNDEVHARDEESSLCCEASDSHYTALVKEGEEEELLLQYDGSDISCCESTQNQLENQRAVSPRTDYGSSQMGPSEINLDEIFEEQLGAVDEQSPLQQHSTSRLCYDMLRSCSSLSGRHLVFDSALRNAGRYQLPANQLNSSQEGGPAIWKVEASPSLLYALNVLLSDPVDRRSRGTAAAQGAIRLASHLVATPWSVLDSEILQSILKPI